MDNKENENLETENLEVNNNLTEESTDNISNNTVAPNIINNVNNATNDDIENPFLKNNFIRFMDKHCFKITVLVGCFYLISSFFVVLTYAYATNTLTTILFNLYVAFFYVHILFWTGLSIYCRNIKYFGHMLLGFLIGFLTCGGLFLTFIAGGSIFSNF